VEEEREGVLARGEVTGPRLPLGPERRRRGEKFYAFGPKIERESSSLFFVSLFF